MTRLAIIPARGGSKRIPRKNIKPFLGEPIISRVISAVRASGLFDVIMVSTDDTEIAAIAEQAGAAVPFMRSAENSRDTSTTADAVCEVLNHYTAQGIAFDTACCIYPTAVLASSATLKNSCERYESGKYETLVPVIAYGHPIQRSFSFKNDDLIALNWPEHALTRTQDLQQNFHDSGQFYWIRPAVFMKTRKFFTATTCGYEVSELEAQDIDNETDWRLAELKFQLAHER